MASVDMTVTGAALGDEYTVRWRVTASSDMPEEIFLVEFATNEFRGVITPSDLAFPTTRTVGQAFYRQSDVTATYATLTEATNAKTNVAQAVQALATLYGANLTTFLTTTSTTITS